jgi:serine/threonine-protein kinase
MSPQPNIAHYRVTSKLGEGGMGAVYRATDTRLNRDVAIKVLPDIFAADPDRMARFGREAQVLASLNHPNIAAIYGVEDRALVMELVEGETLQGPMPVDKALPILHQLIEALEYAHEKGVVHRDLKPANIKVTPEGRVKVLDFGLAKAMGADTPASDPHHSPTLTMRATLAGAIMGTAAYMAPEQARGHKVDKRADIWAFGVVVYEILTGRPLFDADNVSDVLAQVLTKELPLDAAPPRFRPLLQRCLERDQRKRLRDIGDAPLLLDEQPAAAVPAPRNSRAPWVAAIAASLAACVFAWLWSSGGPAPLPPAPLHFTLDAGQRFSFSPDGRWLLNVAPTALRLRPLDGSTWRTLPGTEGGVQPFWAGDSSAIGFFSLGRLRAISIDGSDLRNLAAAPDPVGGDWRGGTAGTILFAAGGSVNALDLSSGKQSVVASGQSISDPAFLPEGDGFVYLAGPQPNARLLRSSLAPNNPPPQPLLNTNWQVSFARHPQTGRWHIFYIGSDEATLYTQPIHPANGTLLDRPALVAEGVSRFGRYSSFDVAANGGLIAWRRSSTSVPIWRLRWHDRQGNVVGTVGDPGSYVSLSLSPDETRLAVVQGYPTERVWLYNLQTGAGATLSTAQGRQSNPVWAPDGRSLYYVVEDDAARRVVRQEPVSGSQPETLYEHTASLLPALQDVTPDGASLLLVANEGVFRLGLGAPAANRKLELIVPGQFAKVRISPDGRSLLLGVGRSLLAVRYPPAGAAPRQVGAFNSFVFPFFPRDGRTLYFFAERFLHSQSVAPDPSGGVRLGERNVLFPAVTPSRATANVGAITRDGTRFLIISTDDDEEIRTHVVSDWTTLLKP